MNGPGVSPAQVTPPSGPSPASAQGHEGLRAQARVKINSAARLLTEIIGALSQTGSLNSEEGKAVVKALSTLAPVTPEVAEGVSQSEIASMLSGLQAAKPAAPQGNPNFPGAMLPGQPRPNVMAGPPMMGR